MFVPLVLLLFSALCVLILVRSGAVRGVWRVSVAALLALTAMSLRYLCIRYETLDYTTFLAQWVNFFRTNGGFSALSRSVGNYNIPYLYFLAAFSYLPVRDLYLIKLLSIAFDILLAWGVMSLAGHFGASPEKRLASFFCVLFFPTVILNGALWGQCDSIFTALGVWSIYCALSDKPIRSMVFLALSFSFKLQAVFFMPVFFLFLMNGKIKWYHLPIFPLTYIVLILPAVLLGRPFMDTILLYFNQASTVGDGLNYNSSSVYAFFRNAPLSAAKYGILAAFILVIVIYLVSVLRFRKLDDRAVFCAAVIFAVGVPFLLPHMHDRYFFPADMLTLTYAFTVRRRELLPLLTFFASFLGYYAYLVQRFLLYVNWGAGALVIVLVLLLADYAAYLFAPSGVPLLSGGSVKNKS